MATFPSCLTVGPIRLLISFYYRAPWSISFHQMHEHIPLHSLQCLPRRRLCSNYRRRQNRGIRTERGLARTAKSWAPPLSGRCRRWARTRRRSIEGSESTRNGSIWSERETTNLAKRLRQQQDWPLRRLLRTLILSLIRWSGEGRPGGDKNLLIRCPTEREISFNNCTNRRHLLCLHQLVYLSNPFPKLGHLFETGVWWGYHILQCTRHAIRWTIGAYINFMTYRYF